jgi:cystathionine beta-lyase/cystathionine gamma-synthase
MNPPSAATARQPKKSEHATALRAETRALQTRIDGSGAAPAVTPLYLASAFAAGSPYFYSRKDNPNVAELEQVVAALEEAKYGVAVASGMAAVFAVSELVSPGDLVVVNRDLYGCSFKLWQRLAQRRNFRMVVLDLADPADRASIPDDVRIVFFETPTNPFLKTIPIQQVAATAKSRSRRALVVVDNTWATPLFQHPLALGADISLHSGTKYFSGHSDAMSGMLLTDREELNDEFRQQRFYGGAVLAPHTAWLTRRSLQTLGVRLRQQQRVTEVLCRFLKDQPQIQRVYQPDVDGIQLTGYGGIVFVALRADLTDQYATFAEALTLFGTGTAMAAVTSTVSQPYSGSHASLGADEKAAMGLHPGIVRLCFGLEDPVDLMADLQRGLAALDA